MPENTQQTPVELLSELIQLMRAAQLEDTSILDFVERATVVSIYELAEVIDATLQAHLASETQSEETEAQALQTLWQQVDNLQ